VQFYSYLAMIVGSPWDYITFTKIVKLNFEMWKYVCRWHKKTSSFSNKDTPKKAFKDVSKMGEKEFRCHNVKLRV